MNRRRSLLLFAIAILHLAVARFPTNELGATAPAVPDRLSDREFWTLVTEMSEPNGQFRSDNLLSNEIYLSVRPQRPRPADADEPRLSRRRPGAELHLYRRRQAEDGVHRRRAPRQPASASHVQGDLRDVERPRRLRLPPVLAQAAGGACRHRRRRTTSSMRSTSRSRARRSSRRTSSGCSITSRRSGIFGLSQEDLAGIEYVYGNFSWHGPGLSYWSTGGVGGGRNAPTYWDLMVADDGKGQMRSFLANDDNFKVMKDLHEKNLLVPVVGNFAGPKAAARGRPLPPRARSHGRRVLSLERRAVLEPGRQLAQLL